MMYAHVTDGLVDQVGGLPRLVFEGGRWWDLRPKDPALLAQHGWYEVVETERPADTATTTADLTYTYADGAVTQTWTVRDKTPEELAADAEQAEQVKLAADTEAVVRAMVATAQPPADGQAWTQPTSAQDAYPLGATVTHGGKTWESLVAFCVWEPGVSGWREVVQDGYPEWVQPTGAQDAWPLGAIVTHNGANWRSLVAANVWEPSASVPTLWELV